MKRYRPRTFPLKQRLASGTLWGGRAVRKPPRRSVADNDLYVGYAPPVSASFRGRLVSYLDAWFPWLVLAAAGIRLHQFTNRWAVNVLMLDQWDYFTPMFQEQGLYALFTFKHGPHRQGLGYLLTYWIFGLTDWNSRAEAFLNCFLLIGAAALVLWLKARIFGRLRWYDAVLPMFILTPMQMDHLVITLNPSHSVVPLVLILACAHALISTPAWMRYGVSAVINVFATFTGFSVFVSPTLFVIYLVRAYRAIRQRSGKDLAWAIAGMVAVFATIKWFLYGYTVAAAVPGWVFPDPRWHLYPSFVAIALGNILLHGLNDIVKLEAAGWLVIALILVALVRHGFRAFRIPRTNEAARDRRLDDLVTFFLVYGLAFAASMAIGRLILGIEAGRAARYYALLCILFFGLYFAAMAWRTPSFRIALVTVMVFCAVNLCVFIDPTDAGNIRAYSHAKKAFVRTYLETNDSNKAVTAANGLVFPSAERTHMDEKLKYMRDRRLNLFRSLPKDRPATK